MRKIAIVTSAPMTISAFMMNHVQSLSKEYDVYLISNFNLNENKYPDLDDYTLIDVKISRKISFLKDFLSLMSLISIFFNHKFDAVHSITPKSGLITSIAGAICRVKFRVHTFTGQVWATKKNAPRYILKFLDRIIYTLNTNILVDSHSQLDFLVKEKVVTTKKAQVLGEGSISGVNTTKFSYSEAAYSKIRNEIGIKNDDVVLLFLGRLYDEKGIPELLVAFKQLQTKYSFLHLVIAGPNEGCYDSVYFDELKLERLHYYGVANKPQDLFSASDILVLPSHREGFGTVVIEAASCKVPTVASNIYGLSDAVINNETGLLHRVNDAEDLQKKLEYLILDKQMRLNLSNAAYLRVNEYFKDSYLSSLLCGFYKENC